ncbi:hypothetical protein HY490_01140 [Candidatus Woesearchaeota archaeon]|nr:hypothetical protein [Candidatus Woesearchaeota archaeon]
MKKTVTFLCAVLVIAAVVFAGHVRVRWTPYGFIVLDNGRWSSLTGGIVMISGRAFATIETAPSDNPEQFANQCKELDAQIMRIYRERIADHVALDPIFVKGCANANVPLPAVLPFVSFERAREEKKLEIARQEEEERKKAPPVEIDIIPPEQPDALAGVCKEVGDAVMKIFREKKGERVAVHPQFIEKCRRVNEPLPALLPIIPHSRLAAKLEQVKQREEEAKRRVEEAERRQAEDAAKAELREQIKEKRRAEEEAKLAAQRQAEEEARKAEEARRKAAEAAQEARKAAEDKARVEAEQEQTAAVPPPPVQQVAPIITTPPAPVPQGVAREIELPEKWVNEYFKFD